jgi:hypothetical protein
MNAVSTDVKDMLEAESALALEFQKDLFIGVEPTKPDNTVTIFDTPSFPPDRYLDPDERYYTSACQIRVRHKSYTSGIALARTIMELLHARANEVWNGTTYTVITANGEPAWLDMDTNNRARFIINFNLQRR